MTPNQLILSHSHRSATPRKGTAARRHQPQSRFRLFDQQLLARGHRAVEPSVCVCGSRSNTPNAAMGGCQVGRPFIYSVQFFLGCRTLSFQRVRNSNFFRARPIVPASLSPASPQLAARSLFELIPSAATIAAAPDSAPESAAT